MINTNFINLLHNIVHKYEIIFIMVIHKLQLFKNINNIEVLEKRYDY